MRSTAHFEAQAETHRVQIAQLIDELRGRARPGEVLDQFLGWENGRQMARNFGNQVRDNPLPLALVGTGVAWMMVAEGRRGRLPDSSVTTGAAPDEEKEDGSGFAARGHRAAEWTRSTASHASNAARSALGSARGTVSDIADTTKSAMGRARQSMSDAATGVSQTASGAWEKSSGAARDTGDAMRGTASSLNDIAHEQPLLVAGVGLALAMLVGSLLPASESENRFLGEHGDTLRKRMGDITSPRGRPIKTVVVRATSDAVKDGSGNPTENLAGQSGTSGAEPVRTGGDDGGGYGSRAYPHH